MIYGFSRFILDNWPEDLIFLRTYSPRGLEAGHSPPRRLRCVIYRSTAYIVIIRSRTDRDRSLRYAIPDLNTKLSQVGA